MENGGRKMDCNRVNYLMGEITPIIAGYLNKLNETHPNTCVHCMGTAYYAIGLTEQFISVDEKKTIVTHGALLHDIGKWEIDDNIINKKGKLTQIERDLLMTHPEKGAQILKSDKEIKREIVNIALYHHERLDGSGYPYGLHTIPLEVSIVSVADVYEALTSKREYKRAYSKAEAMDILMEEAEKNLLSKELCELMSNETPLNYDEKTSLYHKVMKRCNDEILKERCGYGKTNI